MSRFQGWSTLANEAYHLIKSFKEEGYEYPPYSSISLGSQATDRNYLSADKKEEILLWWKEYKKNK